MTKMYMRLYFINKYNYTYITYFIPQNQSFTSLDLNKFIIFYIK